MNVETLKPSNWIIPSDRSSPSIAGGVIVSVAPVVSTEVLPASSSVMRTFISGNNTVANIRRSPLNSTMPVPVNVLPPLSVPTGVKATFDTWPDGTSGTNSLLGLGAAVLPSKV